MLSADLRAFLQPCLAGTLAVADSACTTHSARIWAARALEGEDIVEIYVLREVASPVVDAVAKGGRAAANLIEIPSYRSRSFKGRCAPYPEIDDSFLEQCLRAVNARFQQVGMGADAVAKMLGHYTPPHEMMSLRIEVDSVFDQSPRPGAGARL